jgi:hypothetical protein
LRLQTLWYSNQRGKNERFEKLVRGIIGSTGNDSIMRVVAAASKICVAELKLVRKELLS